MAHQLGIVGASGYGGVELLRLLDHHPALEPAVVAGERAAGSPLAALHPNLDSETLVEPAAVERLAGLDLVFLATPHAAALELGGALYDAGVKVVDLSGAYRLSAEGFREWYGEAHPHPEAAPATYGLTEWNREAVADSAYVANPGCYPTAALLALLPIVGLVEAGSVVVDAKSGTSGAGRGLSERLHHPHAAHDVVAYGAPAHRHTGEIEHWLGALGGADLGPVSFTPHLVPTVRGLLTTCYATLAPSTTADELRAAYLDAYGDEPFVRVLEPGGFPHTKAVHGSNGCQLSALVDERTGRAVITSVIDNLGKGAAGQALQNANVMLGLDETLGLTAVGVYP